MGVACSAERPAAYQNSFINEGHKALNERKFDQALDKFNTALEKTTTDEEIEDLHYFIFMCYREKHDYESAKEWINKYCQILKSEPKRKLAFLESVKIKSMTASYNEIIEEGQLFLATNLRHSDDGIVETFQAEPEEKQEFIIVTYEALARAYIQKSAYGKAIDVCMECLELETQESDSRFFWIHIYIARAYIKNGCIDEGIEHNEKAQEVSTSENIATISLQANQSLALFAAERYEEAIQSATKVVKAAKEEPTILKELFLIIVQSYFFMKNYSKACRWSQEAVGYDEIDRRASQTFFMFIARSLLLSGKWPEAENTFKRISSEYPTTLVSLTSYQALAQIGYLNRDYTGSRKYCQIIIESWSGFVKNALFARVLISLCYLQERNFVKSAEASLDVLKAMANFSAGNLKAVSHFGHFVLAISIVFHHNSGDAKKESIQDYGALYLQDLKIKDEALMLEDLSVLSHHPENLQIAFKHAIKANRTYSTEFCDNLIELMKKQDDMNRFKIKGLMWDIIESHLGPVINFQ